MKRPEFTLSPSSGESTSSGTDYERGKCFRTIQHDAITTGRAVPVTNEGQPKTVSAAAEVPSDAPASRKLKMVGFELRPQQEFTEALTAFATKCQQPAVAGELAPPQPGAPVFADESGNYFIAVPTDEGLRPLPFIPGSCIAPASPEAAQGGFVPFEDQPPSTTGGGAGAGGADDESIGRLFSGMASSLPQPAAQAWLAHAARTAILGGVPGTPMAAVIGMLGLPGGGATNPLAGALSSIVAGGCALPGGTGSLLNSILGSDRAGGLDRLLGGQAMAAALEAAGLGKIPGAAALASMAGGRLGDFVGENAGDLLGGLGSFFGGGDPSNAAGDALGELANSINGFAPGGCIPGGQTAPDLSGITSQAMDEAGNMLMAQWQVDDESSAAEHVAHQAANKYKGQAVAAAKDPGSFTAGVTKFFCGETSAATLAAARMGDKDDKADVVATGMSTVLVEGQPIARMTDLLAPSSMKIAEGAAMVLSGGLPTARVSSATEVPSMIAAGASQVLVGGESAVLTPSDAASAPQTASNSGPAGPDGPESPSSGSESGADSGTGAGSESQDGGATPGDGAGAADSSNSTGEPSTEGTSPSDSTQQSSDSAPGDPASSASDSETTDPSSPSDSTADSPIGEEGMEDGPECRPEGWRDQLRDQLEDEEAGMSWRDPTAKVMDDGVVDTDEHRSRNEYNYCPPERETGVVDGVEWEDKSGLANLYHEPLECVTGRPTDGSLGPGAYECCYHPDTGELTNNVPEGGTYNYDGGKGFSIPWTDIAINEPDWMSDAPGPGHGTVDVLPHEQDPNYDHVNQSLYTPPPSPPSPPPPSDLPDPRQWLE